MYLRQIQIKENVITREARDAGQVFALLRNSTPKPCRWREPDASERAGNYACFRLDTKVRGFEPSKSNYLAFRPTIKTTCVSIRQDKLRGFFL